MADMSAWSRMLAAEATPTLGPCLAPASTLSLGLAAAGGDLASLSLAGPGSRGLSSTARPGSGEPRLSILARDTCQVTPSTSARCGLMRTLIPQLPFLYSMCTYNVATIIGHTLTGWGFRLINGTKIIDGLS